ncbi:RNA polymerase sigma factor [Curtobacterium herbarum]|uniref:Sigma-70 family RNA polymerase sigma factor n=1 Tax=Curtobacterium herbarum TaxID=150122 RepID=A0ABP4K1Y7_9MICO|nr:sigma-70 family RNA polymerase sigma factor [Curtobacterium herbarum]MBM7476669.1 RNA polymerase sigma-70 factor (ECF subfamily) [Curtobacterium herbarum]MCS6546213.1 sigma-70 family RNA polymerase sigma factor [Curtobacterium herbarum]
MPTTTLHDTRPASTDVIVLPTRQRIRAGTQQPHTPEARVAPAPRAGVADQAFAAIVARNSALLRAVAVRILRGSSDADDVVQETFIAAWSHLDVTQDGDAVTAWLVTTVRRRSFDRLRSAAVRYRTQLDDSVPAATEDAPGAVAERTSLVAAAQRILDGMAPVQRRCWELRHLEHRSYAEIAEALDLPQSTVRGQIARARSVIAHSLVLWR